MKSRLYILVGILAMALIGSCTKSDVDSLQNSNDGLIKFRANLSDQTRVKGDYWEDGDDVGIFTDTDENKHWEITQSANGINLLEAYEDSDNIYESIDGAQSYYAYYPYDKTLVGSNYAIDLTDQFSERVGDFLYAQVDPTLDLDINLNFRRPLTTVKLILSSSGVNASNLEDGEITLKNVALKGNFSIMDGTFSSVNYGDLSIKSDDINIIYDQINNNYYIEIQLLPMTDLGGVSITYVSTSHGTILDSRPTATSWESGVQYTYNIALDQNTYYLADFSATMELPQEDEWYIMDANDVDTSTGDNGDEGLTREEFAGLRAALDRVATENTSLPEEQRRRITLIFPNLRSVPKDAFDNDIYVDGAAVTFNAAAFVGISMPMVERINSGAFQNCYGLIEVSSPLVEFVGGAAFMDCISLTQISFPLAKTIEGSAFTSCSSLESVTLPVLTTAGISAFTHCNSLVEISLPSLTTSDQSLFSECKQLKRVSLPQIDTIWGYTFNLCESLTDVSLPAAEVFYSGVFQFCKSLEEITLPAAREIGLGDFAFCRSLKRISLPAAETILHSAFQDNSALQELNIGYDQSGRGNHSTVTSIASSWLYNVTTTGVELNIGYVESSDPNSKIVISGNDLTIGSNPTQTFSKIITPASTLTLNLEDIDATTNTSTSNIWIIRTNPTGYDSSHFDGLKKAMDAAEDDNRQISLIFPDLIEVPSSAFYTKTNLVSVKLPSATIIGADAFYGCTSLVEVVADRVTSINERAFSTCSELSSVSFPLAATMYVSAFEDCVGLKTVSLPAARDIYENVFDSCTGLTHLNIGYDESGDGYHAKISEINANWLFGLGEAKLKEIELKLGDVSESAPSITVVSGNNGTVEITQGANKIKNQFKKVIIPE